MLQATKLNLLMLNKSNTPMPLPKPRYARTPWGGMRRRAAHLAERLYE